MTNERKRPLSKLALNGDEKMQKRRKALSDITNIRSTKKSRGGAKCIECNEKGVSHKGNRCKKFSIATGLPVDPNGKMKAMSDRNNPIINKKVRYLDTFTQSR
jgi:hypothetical protein